MLHHRSFSQVLICGRLTQDAQLRTSKAGMPMLTIGVATTISVKDAASGKYENKTTFHDCIFFGARASKLVEKLKKGSVVCLQGSLSYREAQLANGYKGRIASILIDDIQLLSLAGSAQETSAGSAQTARAAEAPVPASQADCEYF